MYHTTRELSTTITTKPRSRFIAFLLSFLLPGFGQVYNGQLKKVAIFYCLRLLFHLLFGLTRGTTFFYGLFFLLVVEIALRIYLIIDAVKNVNQEMGHVSKAYNTWYYNLLIGIGIFAIFKIFDSRKTLGVQNFKVPTVSNNPTFQVGDKLVADMRAYENNEPDYGDLVVYSSANGQNYTFRIVGRPNDNIELIDNIVSINGKPSKATFIKETINDKIRVFEFEEELPNKHKHLIYKFKYDTNSTKANIKNIVVPSDSYYLLGDNRDNALDSRYEGFINKDKINGRIMYSYWGQTAKRINIDFRDK